MYGRKIYADHQLIINQQPISGVTSFNGDFDIPYENVDLLGGYALPEIQGETSRNISFSRFLSQSDHLRYLTGDFICSGFVLYNNFSYGFSSGYLTNYNVSCEIGSIAQIQTDLIVYGNIGGGVNHPIINSQNTDNIYIANFGSIDLNLNEGSINRITSFNYSVSCERIPVFSLGSLNPSHVFLKKPLNIELSITIDVDDYESDSVLDLICTPNVQNLRIDLKNCDKSQIIDSLFAPNARLVSNSYDVDIDTQSNIEMTFKSFIV